LNFSGQKSDVEKEAPFSQANFQKASRSVMHLRKMARAGKDETERKQKKKRAKGVIWLEPEFLAEVKDEKVEREGAKSMQSEEAELLGGETLVPLLDQLPARENVDDDVAHHKAEDPKMHQP